MNSRIQNTFAQCKKEGRACFVAYLCAGDPNYEDSIEACRSLIDSGIDILELGVPFSDPLACLLYTSPSPRDISGSRMPSSA